MAEEDQLPQKPIPTSFEGDQRGAVFDVNTRTDTFPVYNQQDETDDINQRGIDYITVPSVPGGGSAPGGGGVHDGFEERDGVSICTDGDTVETGTILFKPDE